MQMRQPFQETEIVIPVEEPRLPLKAQDWRKEKARLTVKAMAKKQVVFLPRQAVEFPGTLLPGTIL